MALNGGQSYRFDEVGAPSGNGTLANPYIKFILDRFGNVVSSGNDNTGTSLDSSFYFTPSASGLYYVGAGAAGSATGSYQLYVTGQSYIRYDAATGAARDGSGDLSICGNNSMYCGTATCGANATGVNTISPLTTTGNAPVNIDICGARAAALTNSRLNLGNVADLDVLSGTVFNTTCGARSSAVAVYGCASDATSGLAGSRMVSGACIANINMCQTRFSTTSDIQSRCFPHVRARHSHGAGLFDE